MTLNEHIIKVIKLYPTLFTNRTDVLHHLFCVIGNGYDWKGGRLVAPRHQTDRRDPEENIHTYESYIAEYHYNADVHKFQEEIFRKIVEDNNERCRYRIDHAEELALTTGTLSYIYPLCEYSKMNTVPNNVKPDWLDGCVEMIFTVITTVQTKYYEEINHENNIKFAENCLHTLTQRFGEGILGDRSI
jgi:hypothetical protein